MLSASPEFSISFTFSTSKETDPLAAQLTITDANVISISGNQPVQIQAAQYAMPLFQSIAIAEKSISMQAQKNTPNDLQSVTVIVSVSPVGKTLKVNLAPLGSGQVLAQYQFPGYPQRGNIPSGQPVEIPFPT